MFKKFVIIFLIVNLVQSYKVSAQSSGTPNQIRVKTDANGYLVVSGAAQTNPISQPTVFTNTRLKTDANGYLLVVLSGGAAPSDAHYVTTQAETGLTNEFSLGTLTTGLLLNTVAGAVGTPSAYAGTTCSTGVLTVLNASASGTCTLIPALTGIKPTADSTTAFTIFKADGTTGLFVLDTSNGRIGLGAGTAPGALFNATFAANTQDGIFITNTTSDINAKAIYRSTAGTSIVTLYNMSQGYTTSGQYIASTGLLESNNGLGISARGANTIKYYINDTLAATQSSTGLVMVSNIQAPTYNLGSNLFCSSTAPTRSSGFGTNADASFATGSTACAFDMNIGTGGAPTSGVLTMPTAAHGWICQAHDATTIADNTYQSAYTVSTVTLTSTLAWSANDHLYVNCAAF